MVEDAERDLGWLIACEEAGRYLALTRELVRSLADTLQPLQSDPVLEVCAGNGELAHALAGEGMSVITADSTDPGRDAETVLASTRPQTVLGAFVPFDTGVDEAVLGSPSVQTYMVLNARIGGLLGSPSLWDRPDWQAIPQPEIARWMITRHDVWIPGHANGALQRHGEAWLFRRRDAPASPP